MWKSFTCNSKKNYNFFTVPLQSVLYLALQLGRVFRVGNLRLHEKQVIILVLSLIFPTITARKRNASNGLF